MTGTVDDNRRFINIDIFHPGGSNVWLFGVCYIVFAPQIRTPGKYLIGDNAYVNTPYMATPYKQGSVFEDDYNFYHSQLHINVECAFGMLMK